MFTENGKTYLYTGFCGRGDKSRHGSMCTTLGPDMLTIIEDPVFVVPGCEYSSGTGFEGHAFFEASSIRKIGETYYFIYSSEVMHELCYATSDNPRGGFKYGGVIVSNCDAHIDSYKPADMRAAPAGNNHGSIVEINGQWYIFYHRQTNGTWYSRQGCAEKITVQPDGSIRQVEITSCGLNGVRSRARATILRISLAICSTKTAVTLRSHRTARDGDEIEGHIDGIVNGSIIGFKSFDFKGVSEISIWARGYAKGRFEVKTSWDGETLAALDIDYTNIWWKYTANIAIPDGVHSLYFKYIGGGNPHFKGFELR